MSDISECALKGWHPGEVAIQNMMHLPGRVSITAVVNKLPEQHRLFHTTRLHFLPFTTLDDQGRPWASILTSRNGEPAFIASPSSTTLEIRARVWAGEPTVKNLCGARKAPDTQLVSGLGIEVSTRRRNKFAGSVLDASAFGEDMLLQLTINQALGLCPKYINVRKLTPHPDTTPRLIHETPVMSPAGRLPEDVIDFIHAADTAYLGTSYVARPEDEAMYPSHLGSNHRGGRPGFIRVRPTDGRTLVLPNYSGNRLMSSLGNIHITPLAGLVFPSFADGSILYVTGTAKTLFGAPARELMPLANVVTTITVTGYVFIRNALPLREDPDEGAERSPYSPPVRYLAEEKPPETAYDDVSLSLVRGRIHNDTLVTITMESSRPLDIGPSQNVVLDLSHFLREQSHRLLDWTEDESTENDDCVRTWTVSIPPTTKDPTTFSITVRVIEGGLITPILYRIIKGALASPGEVDLKPLKMTAKLRGIGGNLPAPEPIAACDGGRRLLWIAGGIGLTPFLSLTRFVTRLAKRTFGLWDIALVISTREPEVMMNLILDALDALHDVEASDISYTIHMFTPTSYARPSRLPTFVALHIHDGRLDDSGNFFRGLKAKEREPHICGPLPFVTTAMAALKSAGVDLETVKRERFTY